MKEEMKIYASISLLQAAPSMTRKELIASVYIALCQALLFPDTLSLSLRSGVAAMSLAA